MDDSELEALIAEVFHKPQTLATLDELRQQARSASLGYRYADRDNNGVLTVDEVMGLCEKMGLRADKTEEELLHRMDKDGSGTVEFSEWIEWWLGRVSKLANPIKQQEIIARNTFARFDADKSNTMDATEFRELIDNLGGEFTDAEVDEVVRLLDADRSGSIDGDEFLCWWTQRSAALRYSSGNIAVKLRKLASRATQRFSTDVFESAWCGDAELVRAFLAGDARASLATDDGNDDWTALHYAAYRGSTLLISILLDAGASVNKPNSLGFSPLFYAAQNGFVDACRLLVERGADPTTWGVEADLWMCPLDHCVDCADLVELFQAHSKCVVPDLADRTDISASISSTGCVSLSMPSSKSISAMPVRKYLVRIHYIEDGKDEFEELMQPAVKPSEKHVFSIQLRKGLSVSAVKCARESTLRVSVTPIDCLMRRGGISPLVTVT